MNILALDQGTTSSRAIVFDSSANPIAKAQVGFEQLYPQDAWVEHDPEEIWQSQLAAINQALTSTPEGSASISAIAITNQRETTILWDKETGTPIYNAIVWQDRRTAPFCDSLTSEEKSKIHKTTGLLADAYFSASKIRWILNNIKGARALAEDGKLAFGTIETWLLWKLTEGKAHKTDITNASRTMLMDIKTGEWDPDMLELFSIPKQLLPEICGNSEFIANTTVLGKNIPVTSMIGDQQAALFGQLCIQKGMIKNTYGTGCFLLMNTGSEVVYSKDKQLTTVAWSINGKTEYALEGSVFNAGSLIKWLIEGLGIVKDPEHLNQLVQSVSSSEGVAVSPALTGLGAPHWDPLARGLIGGLTRASTAAHIARAAVESIALQVNDLVIAMQQDAQIEITELRVDGGVCQSDFLMQLQSDLLEANIIRNQNPEATAKGAALLAGLATKLWPSTDSFHKLEVPNKIFSPQNNATLSKLKHNWSLVVERSKHWAT